MNARDWDESDDDVSWGECGQCGESRPVLMTGDPYVDEIYPEDDNPESPWCRRCFDESADDI